MENSIKLKMSFEEWVEKNKDVIVLTGHIEEDLRRNLHFMTLSRLLPRLENNMCYCIEQDESKRRGFYSLSVNEILSNYAYTMCSVNICVCEGFLEIKQGYIEDYIPKASTNDKYKNQEYAKMLIDLCNQMLEYYKTHK